MTTTTCPPPQGGSSLARAAALAGVSALAGLFLAACGGDSDNPVAPPAAITQVPASAAASDESLEAFAIGLAQSDTTEPLGLDNITTLPSSENTEPIATP